MPNSVGMTGLKWFTCDRCGFTYTVAYRRRQNGLAVCTYLPCFDVALTSDTTLDNTMMFDANDLPTGVNDGR